ncbi:Coenzyme F420 hydrogenase/dehydrogenase, beta subunit C-terminal domain [Clostridium nigeriense]|uniref:Coenzyme F420 hydrogenase/dehydrogenase, beta subunit C-terminal domain n=1 Tax=Clostridium nigeriense TaxID=1805470 RepID=UPI003D340BDA
MNEIKAVYLAKNRDNNVWNSSSSGGVFNALAKDIILRNGIVYGAAYSDNNKVIHLRAETLEECIKFQGSKYVQSEMGNCFKLCKDDLKNGKYVLFTGTPCQIAGLNLFLKDIDTSKLYTQDIICHGVPSPEFYKRYIKFMEKELGSDIKEVNFRSKLLPNDIQDISLKGKNGKVYRSYGTHDIYYNFFLRNIILRPVCYECKFASVDRMSDIILGDYWGNPKNVPYNLKGEKGISAVFINSEKGKELWRDIKDSFNYMESTLEVCIQPNLRAPSEARIDVEMMWNDYEKYTLHKLTDKYIGSYKKMKIERRIKVVLADLNILPVYQNLKRSIKK